MGKKKSDLTGRYREGAKGHCWECGRPEKEHKKGECPHLREHNDHVSRQPKKNLSRDHFGIGLVR